MVTRSWIAGVRSRSLVVLVALLVVSFGCSGAAVAGVKQADRAEVFDKLGVDAVGAHYVVLVDTSTSMGKEQRYERVKAALESFFGALSPSDDLTVITFNERPSIVVYRQKGKQDPAAMIAQLPARLEAQTDIGHALRVAVEQLQDLPASDIASLIVLSDGLHKPPPNSDFPTKEGPAWESLRSAAKELTSTHDVQVYAMALTDGTDVGLVGKVFPGTREIALPKGQLTSYFNGIKDRVRAAKATALLAQDKDGIVQAQWPREALADVDLEAGSATFDLTLKSTMPHVPVTVTGLQVSSSGQLPMKFAVTPQKVTIGPGKTAKVTVQASWKPPDEGGPHLKRTTVRTADLSVKGNVESPWSRVISKDLGVAVPLVFQAGTATLTAEGQTGWALWLVIVIIIVLLFIAVRVARAIWPGGAPRLAGSYGLVPSRGAGEQQRSLSEDAQGGGILWFGGKAGQSQPRVELPGLPDGLDAFRLEARRSKRRGPTETWCCVTGEMSLTAKMPNDEEAGSRFVYFDGGRVPSGAEIQVGGSRILF